MEEHLSQAHLIPLRDPEQSLHETDSFGEAELTDSEHMTVLDVPAMTPDPVTPRKRPSVSRLLQGDGANLITFGFAPGQDLPDHKAAHPITVQCLSGTLDFTCGGQTVRMTPGRVFHLRAYVVHAVECPADAEGEAVLLLTMLTGEQHQ